MPYLVILGEAEGGCLGELGHPGGHDVDGGLLHAVAELKVVAPGGGVAGGVQVAPVVLLCNKVPLLSGLTSLHSEACKPPTLRSMSHINRFCVNSLSDNLGF